MYKKEKDFTLNITFIKRDQTTVQTRPEEVMFPSFPPLHFIEKQNETNFSTHKNMIEFGRN